MSNITKMEIDTKRVSNVEVKKNRFQKTKQEEDILDNGVMYTYWTKVL